MKTSSTALPNSLGRILPLSRQKRQAVVTVALIFGDILAISLAFWLAYYFRFTLLPYYAPFEAEGYRYLVIALIPVWLLIFWVFQLYNPNILFGGLQEYSRALYAISFSIVAVMVVGFLSRDVLFFSRGWLMFSWMLALILVISSRFIFRRLVYIARQHGHMLSPTLLVGANTEGRALADQLRDARNSGLYITGFVDDLLPAGTVVSNGYHVIGCLEDLESLIARNQIEQVIIAPTALSRDQLLNIYRTFNPHPEVTLRLSSGLFEVLNTGLRVKELAFVPLIEVNQVRITGFDAFLKSATDYILTCISLVFLLPIFFILALLIRIDSPGPAIYRRRVMGTNGKQFDAFKFRTMALNGDEILAAYPELKHQLEHEYKIKNDPRVTRIGKFLRQYSLDELPQLFNVLLNQMSLVGPRMISPPEMDQYGSWGMNLLTVRPGITGLWQTSGRSDVSYEERIHMDMYYIRNWTIWNDLYILLTTIPAVIRKKGAY
ncbi:MAG: putative glycosyltransferase [Chloroflexi bacterium]|nr:putative glycosyltransferase [Chloroflexota bacterium]